MSLGMRFLPAASTGAERFESFFDVYLVIGTLLFVATLGACFYFVFKYKRKTENDHTPYIAGNYIVEFTSIFLIAMWAAVFFLWGWHDYKDLISPRQDEYEINVIGQQWNWQIQYTNGKNLTNEMYVPINKPVKLIMTSKDVLHSFYVPAFRNKADTVPGQFTTLRFEANKIGTYHLFCAEFCGTAHSKMIGKVHVVSQDDFKKWLDGAYVAPKEEAFSQINDKPLANLSLAELGKKVYQEKSCNTCHSINGARVIGPSFKGLFGSEVELIGGEKVSVDENYVRESIMDPMKKIVKGYSPSMPTFRGMLSDEEVNQLIAYMKTLK